MKERSLFVTKHAIRAVMVFAFVGCTLTEAGRSKAAPAAPRVVRRPRVEDPGTTTDKKTKQCPDTCQLKRRIGKVAASIDYRLSAVGNKSSLPHSGALLATPPGVEEFLEELRGNLSAKVQEELDQSIGELKGMVVRGQEAIEATRAEVNELLRSIPLALARAEETPAASSPRLLEAASLMNRTMRRLKQQNALLRKRARETQESTIVIREQNHILSSQNRELRLFGETLHQRVQNFRMQIENLEIAVEALNRSCGGSEASGRYGQEIRRLEGRIWSTELAAAETREKLTRMSEMLRRLGADESAPIQATTSLPQPENPPNDCQELLEMGYVTSGVYRVRPRQSQRAFDAFCEQQYYGGGWTVIQRRRDGSVDFDRSWEEYSTGFGDPAGEVWLGNENIHQLTNQNSYRLHVVLLDWEGERKYAEYNGFRISSSRDYFSLRFGGYSGTAGDAMRGAAEDGSQSLHLSRFGTKDLDNDSCRPCMYEGQTFESCARLHRGGWWYRACADANLNGKYVHPSNFSSCSGGACFGIQWRTWHEEPGYSLKASLMMLKANGAGT